MISILVAQAPLRLAQPFPYISPCASPGPRLERLPSLSPPRPTPPPRTPTPPMPYTVGPQALAWLPHDWLRNVRAARTGELWPVPRKEPRGLQLWEKPTAIIYGDKDDETDFMWVDLAGDRSHVWRPSALVMFREYRQRLAKEKGREPKLPVRHGRPCSIVSAPWSYHQEQNRWYQKLLEDRAWWLKEHLWVFQGKEAPSQALAWHARVYRANGLFRS